jgi:hypothetical protein
LLGGAAGDEPASQVAGGDGAAAAVRQALEAERSNDGAARVKHLCDALAADATCAPAHWHLGRVFVEGQWHDVDVAAKLTANSSHYAQYRQQREALGGDPKKDLRLAKWCELAGMPDRAKLHYARVLLNRSATGSQAEEAKKELELEQFGGRYLTRDEIAAEERKLAQAAEAFQIWRPKLANWQKAIEGNSAARAEYALEQLQAVDDAAVIPVLEASLPSASETMSLAIIAVLARFPEQRSTEALTRAAVLSAHPRARDAAVAELKQRKLHDYVPLLMSALNPYTRSQFAIQHSPDGAVRYVHNVYQERPDRNVLATKERLAQPVNVERVVPTTDIDERGTSPLFRTNEDLYLLLEARQAASQVERQVAAMNAAAQRFNRAVFDALEQTTQQQLPRDPTKWWTWWKEYNEVDSSRPTYAFVDRYASKFVSTYQTTVRHSCFVPGTLVWTESGPQAIETIQVGDRVLSQDPDTGELALKLVVRTTVSPPSRLLELRVGEESIVASLGHPFWVNGLGWRMIKELKTEDRLHSWAGSLEVAEVIQRTDQQPVHNLVVADFHSYFVGQNKVLVHDNTYRTPTRALVPGLVAAR